MKSLSIWLTAIVTLCVVSLQAQNVPDLMYYKFNEAGQTTVPNEASAPVGTNPAPILGGMTQSGTGLEGTALVGTGASSATAYVNTGYAVNLTSSWTIAFWTSNVSPSTTLYYILGDVNAGGLRCFTNGAAGATNWLLRGPFTDVFINGGATVAPHMMHYVYDATVPEIRGYLDGVLVTTVAQSAITLSGTGPFKVGGYSSSTGLSGNMDEFRWYSSALTPAEIQLTYNQTLPLIFNSFPYCEDFEQSDGNWVEDGIQSSWEHGEPVGTAIDEAASGINAWVTNLDGDHNNNEFSYVVSPQFDLSSLIDPEISMMVAQELENGNDGVIFQYSTDSLVSWTTLGSSTSPAPWFNTATVPLLAFFGGASGWSGSQTAWSLMNHSLSTIAVDTSVFFRFALASTGSTTNEGFGFDDIIVGESNDVTFETLIAPDSTCGSSETEILGVFCNKSVVEMTAFTVVLDTGGTNISVIFNDTIPVCGCDTMVLATLNTSNGIDIDIDGWIQNSGDVNSANDSAAASMLLYPTPSGTVIGGGSYCDGDIAQVTFIMDGSSPYDFSFTNGTTPQFVNNLGSDTFMFDATVGGLYEIIALTDSTGCSGDTGTFFGSANIIFNPAPALELGNDTTVCGSVVLDAGAGLTTYDWSTGATSQTVTIDLTGTYDVTVTDANGCTNVDDIDIAVNPIPVVSMDDTVICNGSTYTFNAGAPYLGYLWGDGSTGQLLTVNSVTTVSVTVTDFNGCEGSTSASITALVPNPTPSVSSASGLAPLTLDAGAGYIAYDWVTNATTQTIDVFASGTYTVTVTDDNGCEGIAEGTASVWPNGVEDVTLNQQGIGVFPNPAVDQVKIVVADDAITQINIELLDLLGKQVAAETLGNVSSTRYEWSLPGHISAGQYMIRVKDAEGTIIGDERLIVR